MCRRFCVGQILQESQSSTSRSQQVQTEDIDIVVIAADVDDYRAGVVAQHRIMLRLKPEATAEEVVAQLWQMFPDKSAAIQ